MEVDGAAAMLVRDAKTTACLASWSSQGPRYTSYPPATEFAAVSTGAVHAELAALRDRGEPIALYVHVPFCRSLCWYCGCNVIPTRDAARGAPYVDQLVAELALVAADLGRAPVAEIALGGGSPNFLAPPLLHALVEAIERHLAPLPDARRSIELDPRSTTTSQIDALAHLGFRSLSMGVQDFAPGVQDAINRHQSVAQTRWLVERSRAAGFEDINVDIVYGLPFQTPETFATTLDRVIELAPDRVALFGYAHMPSRLPHQQLVERAGTVLEGFERAELLLLALERFRDAGYVHLGLDHFARPGAALARAASEGRMTRTFQGYVERRATATIGIGSSAISSTPRMHWQNHARLPAWEQEVAGGRLPIARGIQLDDDDRVRAAVIERLMCDGRVELDQLVTDPEVYFARELAGLAALAELASYDPASRTVATTAIGRLLVRNVCMLFDRYQATRPAGPRFSSTI